MEDEIRNKVKESKLKTLDLADFLPKNEVLGIDIAEQLWQGLVLKEKEFRNWIKENDWSKYQGKAVYIYCSADAIIPSWAYILIASSLHDHAVKIVCGDKNYLINSLVLEEIKKLDPKDFDNESVIIKGCADIPNPEIAMTQLTLHLQSYARSIMYGEPCSTVPIYKRKRA